MIVAIFIRCAFEELVRIENSTGRPVGVKQRTVLVPGKSRGLQELPRMFERTRRMRYGGIGPQLISRRPLIPQRRRAPGINEPHDPLAINRRRNGLPETQILKPRLFLRNIRQILRAEIVQIEKKKIVFEPRAQIVKMIALRQLLSLQHREIVRAETAEHVRLSRLKSDHLRVFARNKREDNLIEIGKPNARAIRFPIIRIPLQHHALPGNVLLQPECAESGKLARLHRKIPRLRKSSIVVSLLQEVPRKNGDAVEKPFRGGIRLRKFKPHRVIIHLRNRDRFSANDEQIALR